MPKKEHESITSSLGIYVHVHVYIYIYRIVSYFRGLYIQCIYISQNEHFCEECAHEVATLGMWAWFSINFAKINSANRSNFDIREIYTPRK